MPHNHRPLCCCQLDPDDVECGALIGEHVHPLVRCPSCVEHGDLAQPQCDQCHELVGRPHTEYCTHTGTVQ